MRTRSGQRQQPADQNIQSEASRRFHFPQPDNHAWTGQNNQQYVTETDLHELQLAWVRRVHAAPSSNAQIAVVLASSQSCPGVAQGTSGTA